MSYRLKCVCILCWWIQYVCGLVLYTPVVEISQGKLRGLRSISGQNQYYGIPYAVSERFQSPNPPRKWSGIFHATSLFDSCAQAFAIFKLGDENCHLLNVHTPEKAKRGDKLPILVFFHGGGYYYGSKWHYDPEFLVTKNVIVITVNYRLGVLGFLCLNNVANLGLKDQTAALIWIQKNMAAFGGDPDNVTVSGHSAGASSAAMHLLSKKSKGLFHKAILMSGVAITPWAFNLEPLIPAIEDAAKIATVKNEIDVYNTFLKASISDLLTATLGTSIDLRYFKYAPCTDSNFTDPYFHDTPHNIIKSGDFNKVPMIIGFTDMEGILFYGLNSQRTLENLDNNFAESLPSVFSWCSDKDKRKIAKKIRSHYFGKQRITKRSEAVMKGVVEFYSDWLAFASVDAFSKLIAKYSEKPVYNYMFSYEGGRNFAKAMFNFKLKGVSHIDDIFYAFKPAGLTLGLNDADRLVKEKYTTLLTNFMKFGDPTPYPTKLLPIRWPATTANRSQVMRIDQQLSVTDLPASHKGQFMLSLLCEHGLQGYVPCDSAMRCNLDQ